ncbi:hypothetical protein Emed_005800 [Eimeria media]
MEASSELVGSVGCMRSRSPISSPFSTAGVQTPQQPCEQPASHPPPPWVDELRQPQTVKGRGRRGEKNEGEAAAVYRHRMRSQAALFEDLVKQQIRTLSIDSAEQPQIHLLGVGEGCAHAIIYASCFPRRVKSLVLLGPLLELREHPENGPLENLILKRIRVYRQLTSRLPSNAFMPSLPPPKISFLEWLAAGFARAAPKTTLANLLQLTCQTTTDEKRDSLLSPDQLLAVLQQQQPLQQLLLQQQPQQQQPGRESSSRGGDSSIYGNNKAASWRMQQQEAWEREREVYRQLVLRLQHLTGSCCMQHRLLGFLEDALLLAPHAGAAAAASENKISTLLLKHLEQLQVNYSIVRMNKEWGVVKKRDFSLLLPTRSNEGHLALETIAAAAATAAATAATAAAAAATAAAQRYLRDTQNTNCLLNASLD